MGSKGQPDGIVTLRQMAAATLGSAGASAVSVIYLFIAYSLLIAYDSKIGSIVGSWNSSIPAVASASIFTAAMLYIISAGMQPIQPAYGVLLLEEEVRFHPSLTVICDTYSVHSTFSRPWAFTCNLTNVFPTLAWGLLGT